jgi:hypothetical protein
MTKNDDLILCLTEEQSQQIRRLTGQETEELKLAVMNGSEAIVLAWGLPRKLGEDASRPENSRAQK